jgi:hypothetical protein
VALAGPSPGATKSFVLNYFYPANYFAADTCPHGLNPLADVFFRRDLRTLGIPQGDIEAMFKSDYNMENGAATTQWVRLVATRGNGRDNVYVNPTTAPDPHLYPAEGRFAYGFNLDGRGAGSPNSYEDPLTHEKGVNNQLFRAIGCIQAYKGNPPPQPPLEAEYRWDYTRAVMGAWLISISGADLSKDGDVTVVFEQSIDPVTTQDANAHLLADMTYRVAKTPASINVLHGTMKAGVIITDPAVIAMKCDSYIQPVFEFTQARMRLVFRRDGTLEGVLGGYQPWYPIYWSHAKVGYIDERGYSVDVPGLYYMLHRYADASPDRITGENTAISAAYMIQAVPAFIVPQDDAGVRSVRKTKPAASPERVVGTAQRFMDTALSLASWNSEPQVAGSQPLTRRLSADQLQRVIADAFGPSIKVEGRLEPELRDDGLFAIGAGRVGVTAAGMEQYDAMSRAIAAEVVSERYRTTLIPCRPVSAVLPDDACARRFFELRGALLYRRPLRSDEIGVLVAVARASAAALKSFYAGLGMSLAGLLESPRFLFREELAIRDPVETGSYRLDAYSTASRLSFFLWDSGPDRQLLSAAQSGDLYTSKGLGTQVDRMLASPRLERGIRAFFADMLQFDLFDTLAKDSKIFPKWTVKVAQDAEEQTLRSIVDLLLAQNGDYRDLFTSRKTFLTPLLGSIYRVPVRQNESPWQTYTFPEGDLHIGIQSQVSFVALHSHEGLSSPTLRGKALREVLLCEPIPAPPANVNFAVAQDTTNPILKTMRDRLTAHRTEPTCAGCHKLMDPLGLALETFDSDGGYRTMENGQPLDTSGELDGIQFSDAVGLGRALHDNPASSQCVVRRLYSYATGRPPRRPDMSWIRYLEKEFVLDGYRVPELMRRISMSSNFSRVTKPSVPALVASQSYPGTQR